MNSEQTNTVVPVLGYHSISDECHDGDIRWSVSPGDFEEQMALLATRGCTPLSVGEYAAALRGAGSLPPNLVLVTFDDGFADLATTALPILARHGIKATAYVITNTLNTTHALDWDQVADLRAHQIEIGSHSHTHRALDCLSSAEVRREVMTSKLALEDGLQQEVTSFAYPYGYNSRAVRREVKAAGYTSACGVKNALSHPGDDVFAIARILIERDMGVMTLSALLDGRGWPSAWRGERVSTRAWRAYRRLRARLPRTGRAPDPQPVSAGSGEVSL